MNLPNRLTIFRIILIPVIVLIYLFPYAKFGIEVPSYMVADVSISLINIICLIVYVMAAITDALDGNYARKHHMITTFGKFADPIADKLLTTTMFLLFVSRGIIPVIPVILMMARDTVVDGARMIASSNGKVVAAGTMGKLKTVLQMITVALILLNNLPFEVFHLPVSIVLLWFSAFVSILSGIQYLNQLKDDIFETI
ncbi:MULTISPECIES: CDP-diacylglycerol--glycerol-3-phosphate 3-phosphatidyltransferase [Terrabacteria group]|uniref:CDP-diacylglycerol--glycerol-3-phosphate 3-phosphatidyltransferase n=1 Tax=Bacillati TaxID=1783272 RepID=UPI0019396E7E|nr:MULTISPECIES: CDP-diacylglycerol--glycerol-3-phosphate 3-phosphatidyltransferase [Terrabacteria group]MBW9212080.1 CDP-diacylglycerol--glycerol-3-phosphate 3-phosphatidyltransferase [Trueperella sp. zg.1013]QRG87114.1 CDP-diacylglycerol--glycerol-3-phosphate 3-phosphatidyltransferase [Bulleidia sp. zg-1006]